MGSKSTADFDSFPGLMKLFKWKTECLLCPGQTNSPAPVRGWQVIGEAEACSSGRMQIEFPDTERMCTCLQGS